MAQRTYLECDCCKAEGHKGGVGTNDIVHVDIVVELPQKEYRSADLCSTCREELAAALDKYVSKS